MFFRDIKDCPLGKRVMFRGTKTKYDGPEGTETVYMSGMIPSGSLRLGRVHAQFEDDFGRPLPFTPDGFSRLPPDTDNDADTIGFYLKGFVMTEVRRMTKDVIRYEPSSDNMDGAEYMDMMDGDKAY